MLCMVSIFLTNLVGAAMLASCPDSPNCVCSLEHREQAKVAPFKVSAKQGDDLIQDVAEIIIKLPRTEILKQKQDYLHVVFKTLLGFKDDVEFWFVQEEKLLHFRSASRVGYYDFGKNRSRYLEIKQKLQKVGLLDVE